MRVCRDMARAARSASVSVFSAQSAAEKGKMPFKANVQLREIAAAAKDRLLTFICALISLAFGHKHVVPTLTGQSEYSVKIEPNSRTSNGERGHRPYCR